MSTTIKISLNADEMDQLIHLAEMNLDMVNDLVFENVEEMWPGEDGYLMTPDRAANVRTKLDEEFRKVLSAQRLVDRLKRARAFQVEGPCEV
jgi:hypothetical protein